jgi:SAM-dependent methyltransferase
MYGLDWQNRIVGSYGQWLTLLEGTLAGRRGAHVYDLAAGSGGFLRYAARAVGKRGTAEMRFTSSDLDPEFVELGAKAAARSRANVAFEKRDATNLKPLAGSVDLFVSTQSAHHLSPGLAVRMISEATRAASQGILIVDLRRSATMAIVGCLLDCVTAPFPPLMYDGILSFRRSYLAAEMELLARLAGAEKVDAYAKPPAHFVVHARR